MRVQTLRWRPILDSTNLKQLYSHYKKTRLYRLVESTLTEHPTHLMKFQSSSYPHYLRLLGMPVLSFHSNSKSLLNSVEGEYYRFLTDTFRINAVTPCCHSIFGIQLIFGQLHEHLDTRFY